jgi:hypothetical protein
MASAVPARRAVSRGADRRIVLRRGDQQHHVRLAQAEPAPGRVFRLGLVDHALMGTFDRVQPPDQLARKQAKIFYRTAEQGR